MEEQLQNKWEKIKIFNPKLKFFLEENPDITLLGLAWALIWRFWLVGGLISVGLSVILGIINAI